MTTGRPRLEKITAENVLDACRLEVAPEQRGFVSPVAQSLAEAYVHPDLAWPRLICDGERAVGFVMAYFDLPFDFDAGVPDAPPAPGSGGSPSPPVSRAGATGGSPSGRSTRMIRAGAAGTRSLDRDLRSFRRGRADRLVCPCSRIGEAA
ncbi:hypothetical protein SBADM41S_07658 [Streptomyces badius]